MLLVAVAMLSIFTVHRLALSVYKAEMRANIARLAAVAAALVNPDEHGALQRPDQQGGPEFERVAGPLRKVLKATPDVKYIYTFTAEGDAIRFVVDTAEPGDHDGDGRDDQAKIGEPYDDPDEAMLVTVRTHEPHVNQEPHADEWGVFVSGYHPVLQADGSVACYVGVDVTAEQYQADLSAMDRTAVVAMIPASLISLGVGAVVWRIRLRALRSEAMVRAAELEARATALRVTRMNVELEASTRAALAAERAKGEFLANMSHEIRTPMTAILGYIDLLDDAAVSGEERHEHVGTIRRAGEHLLSVINDILDYSKLEAGKMTVESVPTNPTQLLADVMQMFSDRAKQKGLEFRLEDDGSLPPAVSTDPTRFRQILLNLTGNAIKFTPRGSLRLSSTYDRAAGRWSVTVHDSGIGMTPEQMSRLEDAVHDHDQRFIGPDGRAAFIRRKPSIPIIPGMFAVHSDDLAVETVAAGRLHRDPIDRDGHVLRPGDGGSDAPAARHRRPRARCRGRDGRRDALLRRHGLRPPGHVVRRPRLRGPLPARHLGRGSDVADAEHGVRGARGPRRLGLRDARAHG